MKPSGVGRLPARPQSIRAMNETLLLGEIRRQHNISRAELARACDLSKPTVSVALANLERAGLIRASGVRTGLPGPAAILYEIDPGARHVLALDVGRQFLRGALADFSGAVVARSSVKVGSGSASGGSSGDAGSSGPRGPRGPRGHSGHAQVTELIALADDLCAQVGITRASIDQTVLGSPGVHDPGRDVLTLAGKLTGWDAQLLADLRVAFGASLMIENDVDAAALAEQEHGLGREFDSFGFVSVGTGIGMGLVLDGRLHRGHHGAAGEIGYLPLEHEPSSNARDARRRGSLEAAASAAGIVRSARHAGMAGPISARRVFAAAARGDERAQRVVAQEAVLVAKAICSVVTVVDPGLIILGGGVGRADGFVELVLKELAHIAPVLPELRVSALGDDAVTDGCLAAGADRVWGAVIDSLSDGSPGGRADGGPGGGLMEAQGGGRR